MATRRTTPDVFLIDLRNAHFVSGRSRYLPGDGTWGLLLFLLLFQALGLVFALWIARETVAFTRLRWDGRPAVATVTELHGHADSDGNTYQVEYQLRVLRSTGWLTVRGQDQIGEDAYAELHPQGPIAVTYSASDPTVIRAQAAYWQHPLALLGFGVFLVFWYGVPLALCVWCGRDLQRRYHLARHGTLLRGEVVRCQGHKDDDGDYLLTLDYQVTTPDGRLIMGTVSRTRNELAGEPALPAGTPLAILFCPPQTLRVL